MHFLIGSALLAAIAIAAEPATASGRRLEFTVTPAATGRQLVRLSLPLPPGFLPEGHRLTLSDGHHQTVAAVRVLTWHPTTAQAVRSARRALVTFPHAFANGDPVSFVAEPESAVATRLEPLLVQVKFDGSAISISYQGGPSLTARLLAPARVADMPPTVETVESNAFFFWQRFHLADAHWPRVIEVRADALGQVVLVAHLQRNLPGDAYTPDLGWRIESTAAPGRFHPGRHDFAAGAASKFAFDHDRFRIDHPAAALKQRGYVEVRPGTAGGFDYRYLRCTAGEKVPMQQAAWRKAEAVIAPTAIAPLTASLESAHNVQIDGRLWDALYDTGPPIDLSRQPELAALMHYHHEAIVRAAARGDDWGNVTGYSAGRDSGPAFGMNRLNHCPAIFEEARRSGDRRLRDAAVNWCDNFHDLSIWWGPERTGGTRYNNLLAMNGKPPDSDRHFMWRSNTAVDFCTKGYSAFLLAYEQTGDPRMRKALDAQVNYASQYVHTDRGEARNIGDVDDFLRLYRCTGERRYLDEALRLFRELRPKLSTGLLFSQSGHPLEAHPPFINDDDTGYRHPFAKPYIIGYALLGLPRLARLEANEPQLRGVVQAVADFMAASQDPAGGWRYPHPRSSSLILDQAIEHAWQLAVADTLLGPQPEHLDAIERVLRQRYHGWKQTGQIPSGVAAWELVTGKVRNPADLERIYQHPEDRDPARLQGRHTLVRLFFAGRPGLLPRGAGLLPQTPTSVAASGASQTGRALGGVAGRPEAEP